MTVCGRFPQANSPRRFSVRRSAIHGRGVFALRPIRKGARVIEYIGQRISNREADRRYASQYSSPQRSGISSEAKN